MTDWRVWVRLTGLAFLIVGAVLGATEPITPVLALQLACTVWIGVTFLRPPTYRLKPLLLMVLVSAASLALGYVSKLLHPTAAELPWLAALGASTLIAWITAVLVWTEEPGLPTSPPAARWPGTRRPEARRYDRTANAEHGDLLS